MASEVKQVTFKVDYALGCLRIALRFFFFFFFISTSCHLHTFILIFNRCKMHRDSPRLSPSSRICLCEPSQLSEDTTPPFTHLSIDPFSIFYCSVIHPLPTCSVARQLLNLPEAFLEDALSSKRRRL